MGDTSDSTRRDRIEPAFFDDDPFAELARVIEEPWNAAPSARPASPAAGSREPSSPMSPALRSRADEAPDTFSEAAFDIGATEAPAAAPRPAAPLVEPVTRTGEQAPHAPSDAPVAPAVAAKPTPAPAMTETKPAPAAAEPAVAESERPTAAEVQALSEADFDLDAAFDAEFAAEMSALAPVPQVESPAGAEQQNSAPAVAAQRTPAPTPAAQTPAAPAATQTTAAPSAVTPSAPVAPAKQKPVVASQPAVSESAPDAPAAMAKPVAPSATAQQAAAKPAPTGPAPKAPAPARPSAPIKSEAATPAARTADVAFETEFAAALSGLSAPADPRAGKVSTSHAFAPERECEEDKPVPVNLDDFDALLASELATFNANVLPPETERLAEELTAFTAEAERQASSGPRPATDDVAETFEPQLSDGVVLAEPRSEPVREGRSRDARPARAAGRARLPVSLPKIAASVAAIALLGGGAFAMLSSGGPDAGGDGPLIVRADTEPLKIVPPDPGGREVANKDADIYQTLASGEAVGTATPSQETLITAAEEPIELPKAPERTEYEDLPGVSTSAFGVAVAGERGLAAGDEVEIASAEPDGEAILKPRRVKSVKVLPDGTIVTEDDAAESALIQTASRQISPTDDSLQSAVDALDAAVDPQGASEASSETDATDAVEAPVGEPAAGIPIPSPKPRVAARPAAPETTAPAATPSADPWPEDVRTASIAPAPEPQAAPEPVAPAPAPAASAEATPAAPSGWYVQISSQPTSEAAKTSARNLSQRYASVVGGRSLVIQSADIPGKGTYHRVRVAAASKAEAVSLCENLKSAGGSCFVAR